MDVINLDYIKQRRVNLKISLQEMAEMLHFKNASTYLKYESGAYAFKASQLPELANILKCEITDFFY